MIYYTVIKEIVKNILLELDIKNIGS